MFHMYDAVSTIFSRGFSTFHLIPEVRKGGDGRHDMGIQQPRERTKAGLWKSHKNTWSRKVRVPAKRIVYSVAATDLLGHDSRLTEVIDGLWASCRQVKTNLNGHPICHSHERVNERHARPVMSDAKTCRVHYVSD